MDNSHFKTRCRSVSDNGKQKVPEQLMRACTWNMMITFVWTNVVKNVQNAEPKSVVWWDDESWKQSSHSGQVTAHLVPHLPIHNSKLGKLLSTNSAVFFGKNYKRPLTPHPLWSLLPKKEFCSTHSDPNLLWNAHTGQFILARPLDQTSW